MIVSVTIEWRDHPVVIQSYNLRQRQLNLELVNRDCCVFEAEVKHRNLP